MAILEKTVFVYVGGKTDTYYEELGYDIPKHTDKFGSLKVSKGTQIEVKVEDLPIRSSIKLNVICDYCGEINEKPRPHHKITLSRENNNGKDSCNKCKGDRISESRLNNVPFEKSIAHIAPHLVPEWHLKLNNKTPDKISFGSGKKYWWLCPNCNSEYSTTPDKRINRSQGCPYCAGQKVNNTNCIATTNPEVISQWHPTKNGFKTLYNTSSGHDKKVWWICQDCKSEYDMKPSQKIIRGLGCPYCRKLRINHTNCLSTTHPKIASEWHPTKNGELKPSNFVAGSKQVIWWVCKNNPNHDYDMDIVHRLVGNGCPYCAGKRINESNCLTTTHEYLLKEWDYTKNDLSPNEVSYGSDKIAWWKCSTCDHEWKTAISCRTSGGTGCPLCSASKGERFITEYLSNNQYKFKPQYTFKGLVGIGGNLLKFDFAVKNNKNKLMCLIEYDGEFHYKKIYEEDSHDILVIHDKLKNEYCKKSNIKLIRIPYWEFDNIEKILNQEFKNLISA